MSKSETEPSPYPRFWEVWRRVPHRHRWVCFSDRLKRRCARCGREQWVMSRRFPRIGEAKYFWEDMNFGH